MTIRCTECGTQPIVEQVAQDGVEISCECTLASTYITRRVFAECPTSWQKDAGVTDRLRNL